MTYVDSTDTIRFTEQERKILELALPVLKEIEYETGEPCDHNVDCLYYNYKNNNGKLSAEVDVSYD